jgi:hypothetical protein
LDSFSIIIIRFQGKDYLLNKNDQQRCLKPKLSDSEE